MKEGLSPSKPPSLPRTFPKSTRPDMAKICFAMFGRVLLGKVFCFWGGIFIWCGYRTRFVLEMHKGYPLRRFSPCKKISKKTEQHMGRSLQTLFSILPQSRIPFRTLQKFPPPAQAKTSPQDPHHQKGETKLRSSHGGGLVGKFGEVEGGLEGEGTPSERGFLLPPRSFHPPTSSKTAPERNGRGGRGAQGERK